MTTRRRSDGEAEARSNRLLGQRLALYRSAKGLRLADVAEATGVGLQLIQRYESGETPIQFGRLVQLAQVLGTPLATLIGDGFDMAGDEDPEAQVVLQVARIAGRLPPAKRQVLVALARELGRP